MANFSLDKKAEKKLLKKIFANPAVFIELDDCWLKNNEFVKKIVTEFPLLINFAKYHRHDMSFLIELLKDSSIEHEKKKFWMNILFEEASYRIPELVKFNPMLIEYVSPELNVYPELLLETVLEQPACLTRLVNVREHTVFAKFIVAALPEAIQYVSDYIKFLLIIDDPQLLDYLTDKECSIYQYLLDLKNTMLDNSKSIKFRKQALEFTKKNPFQLINLPEYLRADKDIVTQVVAVHPILIHFADESLKYNLDFLRELIPLIKNPQTHFNNIFNQLINVDGTQLASLISDYPWIMKLLPRDVDQFNFLLGIAVLSDASVLQYFPDYCHDYVFIRSVIVEKPEVINMLGPEMVNQMIYELPHLIKYTHINQ